MNKQISTYFYNMAYTHVFHIIDTSFDEATIEDKRTYLYYGLLSAQRTYETERFAAYMHAYVDTLSVEALSPLQQFQFDFVSISELIEANDFATAKQRIEHCFDFIQQSTEDFHLEYALLTHDRAMLFMMQQQLDDAIKQYNLLDEALLTMLLDEAPLYWNVIHGHLTSAYIRKKQWPTALQIVTFIIEQSTVRMPLATTHSLIRQQFLTYLLYGEPLDFEQCSKLHTRLLFKNKFILNTLYTDLTVMISAIEDEDVRQQANDWLLSWQNVDF